MSFETVNYSLSKRVATLEMNRPQAMNAFNAQLRHDLLAALRRAEADDEVRVIVITGAGRGFGAGADLKEGKGAFDTPEDQILAEYKPIFDTVHDSPKLVIAAINGACAGIAAALAMLCDLAVMAEDAYIYQAFAAIGLVPDGGTAWQLLRALGHKRALEAVVECRRLSAQECLQYGLTNHVVPADELLPFAQGWAERLAAGSPLAQRHAKHALRQAADQSLAATFDLEARLQNDCVASQDARDAVAAFFRKEQPRFRGR